MGRRPETGKARERVLTVRLTDDEYAKVRRRGERQDGSTSRWARRALQFALEAGMRKGWRPGKPTGLAAEPVVPSVVVESVGGHCSGCRCGEGAGELEVEGFTDAP